MAANYDIFQVDLTTAGRRNFKIFSGLLRMVRAVDASGALALTALVEIKLGAVDNAWIPLTYGNAVKIRDIPELTIRWAAQAGVVATFFRSRDGMIADVDSRPPSQLVVGAMASAISTGAATVGVAAGVIAPANANRKSVTIRNEGSAKIYIGTAGVTTANGLPVDAVGGFTFSHSTAAIYGISAAAGNDVRYLEEA